MKKLLTITVLLLLLFQVKVFAQEQTGVKGIIADTLNKQNLSKATICFLRPRDSVLQYFIKSAANGTFIIQQPKAGKYLLLVTYPGYADYFDTITVQQNVVTDVGVVMLSTKAHLLADVTVRQKIAAVRMRGDTIVYKADSFKVRDGASVEELLKKFPGIQVDKNGNITAMGTKVEKVLVDGEEFFGDDPTIATKGLNASMVNEVQVFDKKSDQAVFTGVDDGDVKRTINLKLKDDAKKGWFGKLETGAGLNDTWNNSLMANTFKNKRKLSFYGIASSTGKTGLNWDELGKFGGSSGGGEMVTDDGGMYFTYGGDAFDNSDYWGEGIPKSWSGGINYSNKFKQDKESINASYRYAKIMNEGGGFTNAQSILPDTLFYNTERRSFFGNKDRHALNGNYEWMFDSSFTMKLTVMGNTGTSIGRNVYESDALNGNNQFVNQSIRMNSSTANNKNFKGSLLLRKRFKKIGRSISLNVDQNIGEVNSEGFLYAENKFYNKTGINFLNDTTDQKKLNTNDNNALNTKLAFTEKLAKYSTLEINYTFNLNRFNNKILTYDKNTQGKYEDLNNTFSNDFNFNVTTNKIGSTFQYAPKKVNISVGGDIAYANFTQTDNIVDTTYRYKFTNFFPRASFTYKFNPNKRISVSYNGNTRQPSIQQIQPVADNTNPLLIQIGNANLRQEFTHRFNFNMNNYQVLKNRGYWLGANYSFTNSAIRSSLVTDSVGKTTMQFVNVNGNYNFNANLGYNGKWQKVGLDYYFGLSTGKGNNISFVNNLKNITNTTRYGINNNLGFDKEEKYGIWFWSNFNYNTSTSSIRPDVVTNFWNIDLGIDANVHLPLKLILATDIQQEFRQRTAVFTGNNNVTIWNASLARKILKGDKSQIKLSAFDILNQNRGYSRNINSTTVSENRYQQLSQYFLLSFIWNFSKGGALNN